MQLMWLLQQQYSLGDLRVGDTFQDRRQPGHQDAALGGMPTGQQPLQPAPPGDPLDDSPLPNCPFQEITLTERDKQVLAELRRAPPGLRDGTPALRGLSTRHGMGRKPRWSNARAPVVGSPLPLPLSPALG